MRPAAFQKLNQYGGRSGKARAGMTLIEMMVVIVVIAILFSIMMPAIGRMRERARRAEADATAAALRDAIIQYHFEYGSWPVDYNSIPSGDTYTFAGNNHEVIDRLLINHEDNMKDIPFIYIEDYPLNDDGTAVNPWGDPYEIQFNFDRGTVSVSW